LVTYAAGHVKSTVNYIIVRQEEGAKVRNVKVILNEECVPKHKLPVMDMQLNTTRSPAVARMADRTSPVIKLTLTQTGHNLAKTGTSP